MGLQKQENLLSKHVMFNETSLLKSTISQQVEKMKIKNVSQWVKVDATPPSPDNSISVEISLNVTPGGDHVASLDAEQIEGKADLVVAEETKKNLQKWAMKKCGSQIGDLD